MSGEVRTTNMDVEAGEDERDDGLRVQEIDAYWLQRRIARAFGEDMDASKSQEVAEQVGAVGWVLRQAPIWALGEVAAWPLKLHVVGWCAQR